MRYSRSLGLLIVTCLILLLLGVVPAFSQDPPSVAEGMNPSATYHGGDFDTVDLSTGRLHIHIPLLVDHSQRGKLNFTYSLSYTSTGAWWEPLYPKYGVGTPGFITDGWLSPVQYAHYKDSDGNVWRSSWVPEADGSSHQLGNGETIDGTGIVQSVNLSIINKDGIQFAGSYPPEYFPGVVAEDTNGNEITQYWVIVGNELIYTTGDTLGRTWTMTSGSTDVSGCPAVGLGQVAPSSSTIWTIPGPANVNSGVRTFKLCYSVYALNTGSPVNLTGSPTVATGLVLPDGTTWRFEYSNNSWVDLTAAYPPTGGKISYAWTTIVDPCSGGLGYLRVITQRTVYDGTNSNVWTYSIPATSNPGTGTVTDPLGNHDLPPVSAQVILRHPNC